MSMHGGGRYSFLTSTDERPKVTWALIQRVLRYGVPYRFHIAGMLLLILLHSGLALVSPLILRDLIDRTLPNKDLNRLGLLSLALLFLPLATGIMGVIQRRLNAAVGEGVIYDLRVALYAHLQRMSLRFFTNTKVGELMSRLNNDVVGAQNAISNTTVNIVTNLVQGVAVFLVMFSLEWRLTLISVVILPLLLLVARLLGSRLRLIARQAMEANAQMNAMMNETLNIGGTLLVKLFGRAQTEVMRFDNRASAVRDLGVRRAVLGATFFMVVGLISAVGTALVYGLGGYFVIQGSFSIGTIVAFGAYLGSLYGALQGLANAPTEFATSVVSFERVFEVIDLPMDVPEKPEALALEAVRGELIFENVTFRYQSGDQNPLSEVRRYGMQSVTAALSGEMPGSTGAGKAAESEPSEAAGEAVGETPSSQARLTALEDIPFHV